jgi:multicomponent Na+:H+ antiporter subunit D
MNATWLPPLPVALPLAVAALLASLGSVMPRRLRDAVALGTAAAMLWLCVRLACGAVDERIVYWFGNWVPHQDMALGIAFTVDGLGAVMASLVCLLGCAALTYAWYYFETAGELFGVLMLVFLGGMVGFCLSGDLFNMFVFFELMGVAAYALTGHKIEEEQALEGAFNFAVINSLGAFFILIGIALLYGRHGALNLAQLGVAVTNGPHDGLVLMALVLIVCGYLVKAAVVPFHFWLSDAHAVAPTPVCVMFSGVMVELGWYAVVRVLRTVFAGCWPTAVSHWLVALGCATAVVGAVMCYVQRHLKRLLAFSTISHTGLFVIGAGVLNGAGLAGAVLYIVGHGLVKGALFMCSGILLNRHGSVDERRLHGAERRVSVLALLWLVGGLALAGLPPFGTWLGKTVLEEGVSSAGYEGLWIVFLLSGVLTGGAVLRAFALIFLGWGEAPQGGTLPSSEEKEMAFQGHDLPFITQLPAAVLLLLALGLGVVAERAETVAQRAALQTEDAAGYVQAVMHGAHVLATWPASLPKLELSGGLEAALGALLLAVCSVLWPRCRAAGGRGLERAASCVVGPVRWLRTLHSGHVGQYVTWLVGGTALMGLALEAALRLP